MGGHGIRLNWRGTVAQGYPLTTMPHRFPPHLAAEFQRVPG